MLHGLLARVINLDDSLFTALHCCEADADIA